METDEIRTTLDEARRACAELESARRTGGADAGNLARKLAATMSKLIDATQSLLADREAFTGRLRRTYAVRPPENLGLGAAVPPGSLPHAETTPSPAQDASL